MRDPRVIRVLIVDDHQLVRKGLRSVLAEGEMEVVGECEDGALAAEAALRLHPDVVLMDVRMRGMDGPEATRRIREQPEAPPVLALTTYDDDDTLEAMLTAGAAGFLLKDAPGEEIIRATRSVAAGAGWLDPAVAERVLRVYRGRAASRRAGATLLAQLTPRELEVLELIAQGLSNVEIAGSLFLSEATVKTHINRLLSKLELRDRAQAIVFAYQQGIV
jgi:DNA-binding NarL/FixJ family response regulator